MADGSRITKMAGMSLPPHLERLSFRSALAIGFAVTLGLWLYTGLAFDRRIETVRGVGYMFTE